MIECNSALVGLGKKLDVIVFFVIKAILLVLLCYC